MSDAADGDDAPRKGRSNAILTYETVAALDKKLTEVDTKIDHITDRLASGSKVHEAHEVRIRALELTLSAITAVTTSSRGHWQWVWAAALGLSSLGVALLNYLKP